MAHTRDRLFLELWNKLIGFSPIIGVFGHRQVGKSTFVSSASQEYFTLDDRETLREIEKNPKAFLNAIKSFPAAIDECQGAPDLFPALKEKIRTDKRPGQFVLTGSVRFTSRKAIRESLAGRMLTLEMLPLIISELNDTPLSTAAPRLLDLEEFSENTLEELYQTSRESLAVEKGLHKYLLQGGLPGLCFIREERHRIEGLRSLHELVLDRDLRMIVKTNLSVKTLFDFLQLLGERGWNPINHAEIKRKIGLAHATQSQLLYALESIFLIRRIPLRGRAGEIILFEDQYEERVLSGGRHSEHEQLMSALYRNVRAQFQYRIGDLSKFESYMTRSGARVPLVIRNENGALGLKIMEGETPSLSEKRTADSFLRAEKNGKFVFVGTQRTGARILDSRAMICPITCLL
ncbi:AAA family ATPase [Bdellovibrionota bacterium FG-2]